MANRSSAAFALASVLLVAAVASGQTAAAPPADKPSVPQATPADAPPPPPAAAPAKSNAGVRVSASSADGFLVASDDGSYKLQLKGLVQFDARLFPSDTAGVLLDNFVVRRARPILQGTVARSFDFTFTPDFGVGAAVIQDAFVVARISTALAVEVGKFKPPIGLEHLQPDANVAFAERALPSGLQPSRDVGAELHGQLVQGIVYYAAGVFDGTADGASTDLDTSDGKSAVGRLVLAPFKTRRSVLAGLAVGIAASTEQQSGPNAPLASYRSGGQAVFYSYASGVAPAGTRRRVSPELSFFSGPVGVIAEYVTSTGKLSRTVTSGGTTTTTGPFDFENRAWQVTATVFLTGDESRYDAPRLRRPLDRAKGQWGALQLAARVNGFDADEASYTQGFADPAKSARRARAWAVGLNWHLSRNLKEMASFERTTFTGGASNGGNRPVENALIIRSQLSF